MELVLIFGPPAVGKMTVGHELCKLTGFKLFHNHAAIEPVLEIFPFGSAPFERLVSEFRRRVIEEAAGSGLPGLVFTLVWALELAEDADLVASYGEIVEARGGRLRLVELAAEQSERIARNETEFRLARKASKRDLEFSRRNLLEVDGKHVLNTGSTRTEADALLARHDHLRLDNTALTAAEAAHRIARAYDFG
ncbi:hypothetical protein Kfla_2813 [Kribbella flavida DSM 17836]|uniref:Shikimate kinase n=1 Tax=Kribbella flavida (strain DSM 17836 / JCM 10339 / NBRC 14399) TaxID=479435 RepID=D2Q086_KRIFD|nr:AAA family ATPase [Kribbella flavida]ADB31878.1 hypothetical protein Kfla_2813 [Kribbella flavida DSM 17836]